MQRWARSRVKTPVSIDTNPPYRLTDTRRLSRAVVPHEYGSFGLGHSYGVAKAAGRQSYATVMRVLPPVLLTVATLVFGASVWAQSSTVSGAGQGGDDRLQQMVDKLRVLVDEAERERRSDPYFLRDLRSLIRAYDWPWRVERLRDDFRDGNYRSSPAWAVSEGEFWVDRAGLRSRVRATSAAGTSSGDTGADLAVTILGTILDKQSGSGRAVLPREDRTRLGYIWHAGSTMPSPFRSISWQTRERAGSS